MESYSRASRVSFNVNLRFPSRPTNPFFTDPCSFMIWDQFDVLEGKKTEQDISSRDKPEWRNKMIRAAQTINSWSERGLV